MHKTKQHIRRKKCPRDCCHTLVMFSNVFLLPFDVFMCFLLPISSKLSWIMTLLSAQNSTPRAACFFRTSCPVGWTNLRRCHAATLASRGPPAGHVTGSRVAAIIIALRLFSVRVLAVKTAQALTITTRRTVELSCNRVKSQKQMFLPEKCDFLSSNYSVTTILQHGVFRARHNLWMLITTRCMPSNKISINSISARSCISYVLPY